MNYESYLRAYQNNTTDQSPQVWFNHRVGQFEDGEVLEWLKRFGSDDQFMAYLDGWHKGRLGNIKQATDYEKVIERTAFSTGHQDAIDHDN